MISTRRNAMKMLLVTTILSSLLVHGIAQEDFPDICQNQTLVLRSVRATLLERNFINSPELRCLTMPYGHVSDMVVGAFDSAPSLIYLNLKVNKIPPENMFSFGNMSNLRQLIIRDQDAENFKGVAHVKYVYPSLEYLDLSNKFGYYPIKNMFSDKKHPFPNLKYLDLSGNRFASFAPLQLWDDTLTYLSINDNQLSKVSLEQLRNLVKLLLNDNKLQNIGDNYDLDLSGLDSLEYFSVINNKLDFISKEAFNETLNLRYLDVSKNNLSNLDPETFTHLTSLETVILDYNQFDIIPFKASPSLTTLSMNCNNLTYLSATSLQNLTQLNKLSLAGNMLSLIDADTFESQGLLEELHLNDNQFKYLPEYWCRHLKNLRYLDLSGNSITSIEYMFDTNNLPLERLYLEGNPLKHIEPNVLTVIPRNVTIYLNVGEPRSNNFCER